jgi:PadR family transcriptional regulator, regulatory protein PadR
MKRNRPPSHQTLAVMLALSQKPSEWAHGYELCQKLGLKAGSVYPILIRLADIGWLETAWETEVPSGRPPRHLYRLTSMGVSAAAEQAAVKETAARSELAPLNGLGSL